MNAVALAALSLLAACAGAPPTPTPAPSNASSAPAGKEVLLPDEPWYRDKPEHYDECTEPLARAPEQHFPRPFENCDPTVESFTSPPGGNELHFHYREFSVALTRGRRVAKPATCCYMIFEFPRSDQ